MPGCLSGAETEGSKLRRLSNWRKVLAHPLPPGVGSPGTITQQPDDLSQASRLWACEESGFRCPSRASFGDRDGGFEASHAECAQALGMSGP
jgi:hypothetical protein